MTDARPPKKTDTLEVRMPHETKRAFLEACRKQGRTASEVVRDFVEDYLAREQIRGRLRDPSKPARSLVMNLLTPQGRRAALAAGVGALGLIALTVSPSAAAPDFRAMFEQLDGDRDGRLTLQEFAAPPAAPGDTMIFLRTENVEVVDGEQVSERSEEFWLPAPPPADGVAVETDGGVRREVRILRSVEDGEVVTEEIEGVPFDDERLADLREQEFVRFDGNEDGAVDFTEFETRHNTMIANTFRRLDANDDGRLAADELDAIPVALGLEDLPPPPAPDALSGDGFARLDRDGDGAVSLDEFAAGPATP